MFFLERRIGRQWDLYSNAWMEDQAFEPTIGRDNVYPGVRFVVQSANIGAISPAAHRTASKQYIDQGDRIREMSKKDAVFEVDIRTRSLRIERGL